MNKGAKLSDDRKFRYQLWRIWDDNLPTVAFVGLNPSYADEDINDPTINRCIDFTKRWGYGGFYMINLFAFISTDPNGLSTTSDPIGTKNNENIKEIIGKVDKVICAWGNNGTLNNRHNEVLQLIPNPYCLKLNSSGQPAHPLYLKSDLTPIAFRSTKTTEATLENSNPFLKQTQNTSASSKYINVQENPDKKKFENHHWLKSYFKQEEILLYRININDGEVIFRQSDEIFISDKFVYWYISRVGDYYTKSNGEIDAEHIGETFVIDRNKIKHWKTICIQTTCFMELEVETETKSRATYHSVGVPFSELEKLNELQQMLNKFE